MKYPGDAYAAGLIDGEGCIGVARSKKDKQGQRSYRVIVDVGMTLKALPILQSLREEFGGTVTLNRAATDRWEEAHCWSIGGPLAAQMLQRLLPFLCLKQEQAKLGIALEGIHHDLPVSEYGRGIRRRWTPEARERCEIIRQRVMELNRKGPQPRSSRPPEGAKPFAWRVAGEWKSIDPDLFSEAGLPLSLKTWPAWGTVLGGVAYELPMPDQLTAARESSSSDGDLLPTPRASSSENRTRKVTPSQALGAHGRYLSSEVMALLPTPNTLDSLPPKTPEQIRAHRDEGKGGDRNLREVVLYEIPVVEDRAHVDFGKYESAVRRWESVLGRQVPPPTELREDGKPQLSAKFTEFLMGLPEGWVTDTGIDRDAQLRILGNGCVPQQAALALRILLEGISDDHNGAGFAGDPAGDFLPRLRGAGVPGQLAAQPAGSG